MSIDHSKKPVGGVFTVPTRPSLGFMNLAHCDPVPSVVAGEDGSVIVAWGEISASGANQVKASFYDPGLGTWSIYTIDPAAGISNKPNAYRVAMTRTSTHVYGVWRGADGTYAPLLSPDLRRLSLRDQSERRGAIAGRRKP